jgi:hypothetical protein
MSADAGGGGVQALYEEVPARLAPGNAGHVEHEWEIGRATSHRGSTGVGRPSGVPPPERPCACEYAMLWGGSRRARGRTSAGYSRGRGSTGAHRGRRGLLVRLGGGADVGVDLGAAC